MLYRSPYPDAWIPEVSIDEFVFSGAGSHPDRAALVDGPTGRTITYRTLLDNIASAAATLTANGVGTGDVVALYLPASPESVALFYAVTSLGATVTILNPLHSVAEMAHQLADSGARLAVASHENLETIHRLAARASVTRVLSLDEVAADGHAGVQARPRRFDPRRTVAALTYSTGMTDVPLGVMLTHYNLVANAVQAAIVEPIADDEVIISLTPFCQMYGNVLANLALHAGATVAILPRFNLVSLLKVIQRHRVSTAFLVPAIIRSLAKHPLVADYDLSSLRQIVSMTAPLPDTVARSCAERVGCTVRQAYGMTEAFAFTHVMPRDQARGTGIGVALPNTEFRIVDVASHEDVPPGRLGELWIRGPQVMSGYANFPEVTAGILDADGWLHTADIGFTDDDGNLSLVDRSKKLMKLRTIYRQDDELLRAAVDDMVGRREASERLRNQAILLNSVRESIVVTDLKNRVTFWNAGAEKLFGYSAAEAIGQPVDSLILPAGQQLIMPEKTIALRTRGIWNAQVPRQRKDGSIIWTDLIVSIVRNAEGERAGFVGVYRDITEQKIVEQRLRFQAQLLDSVRESVVATDLEGRILFWGKGAEALFGYASSDVLGSPVEPMALPRSSGTHHDFNAIRDEVLHAGVWEARAVQCWRKSGDFWADIVVAPVRNDDGDAVGLIAIHSDVTELRHNQELLRDSHERLRNLASRLMDIREQERSAIARELHDELGQALTRLGIDLSWLTPQLPRRLRTARVGAIAPLVARMLKTVQHISSELRPALLDDLGLEAAIEWHAREFAEWSGCRCELDLRLGMLPRHKDRDIAVFRILQEALTNVARHARAQVVTIRAWACVRELNLEIEDDGVGIADGDLASAHSLGLIGMRERAEGLGGQITIASPEGRGTIVAFRLPLAEVAAPEVVP